MPHPYGSQKGNMKWSRISYHQKARVSYLWSETGVVPLHWNRHSSMQAPYNPGHLIITLQPPPPDHRPLRVKFHTLHHRTLRGLWFRGDDTVNFWGVLLVKGSYPPARRLLYARMIQEIVRFQAHMKGFCPQQSSQASKTLFCYCSIVN